MECRRWRKEYLEDIPRSPQVTGDLLVINNDFLGTAFFYRLSSLINFFAGNPTCDNSELAFN